jgi:hypothetical protein
MLTEKKNHKITWSQTKSIEANLLILGAILVILTKLVNIFYQIGFILLKYVFWKLITKVSVCYLTL